MYIDSRIYVTVCSRVEHEIIDLGQKLFLHIIGDSADAISFPTITEDEGIPRDLRTDEERMLYEKCEHVCSLLDEHLETMAKEWVGFLTRVRAGIRGELQAIRTDVDRITGTTNCQKHLQVLREQFDYVYVKIALFVRATSCATAVFAYPPWLPRPRGLPHGTRALRLDVG